MLLLCFVEFFRALARRSHFGDVRFLSRSKVMSPERLGERKVGPWDGLKDRLWVNTFELFNGL